MAPGRLTRIRGYVLWRQVALALEEEIISGKMTPGTPLPAAGEIAERFGVNLHTVRRALQDLQTRGLVVTRQGSGTFVAEAVLDYPVGRRTRFSESVRRQNHEPEGRILQVQTLPADDELAALLGIAPGRPVVIAHRLNLVDGRPLCIGRHCFPADRFPEIGAALRQDSSVTRALARFGIADFRRRVTRVTTRLPTPDEAALLQQPLAVPVLLTEAVNVDLAGAPIEASFGCYAADRVQLVTEAGEG
ncbi:phosphonate metabolism transcriptional regulator PhnF [Belnapia sp. T6]|uniref:Phosphonate metabolism transcriptional regulator PhnF n=2 Tax=Belnapia mucosa TaxID=2804532 RepID=A0ABS1V6Q9_9PROT|nr:phosphonate metabolism transcriptional regulator PhnF [Belnapia mucosa]